MKLKDAFWCPDCDEISTYNEQILRNVHYPACPICGNKNMLSLSHVLNRKEEGKENETSLEYVAIGSGGVPDHEPGNTDSSDHGGRKETKQIAGGLDQVEDGRSGREDIVGNFHDVKANSLVAGITSLTNVLGILFQEHCRIGKAISRFDANPKEQSPPT